MAKDKESPKYEGYQEYPKYVGSGGNRRIVNNEDEEAAHTKEFPEEASDDAKPKTGWATPKKS